MLDCRLRRANGKTIDGEALIDIQTVATTTDTEVKVLLEEHQQQLQGEHQEHKRDMKRSEAGSVAVSAEAAAATMMITSMEAVGEHGMKRINAENGLTLPADDRIRVQGVSILAMDEEDVIGEEEAMTATMESTPVTNNHEDTNSPLTPHPLSSSSGRRPPLSPLQRISNIYSNGQQQHSLSSSSGAFGIRGVQTVTSESGNSSGRVVSPQNSRRFKEATARVAVDALTRQLKRVANEASPPPPPSSKSSTSGGEAMNRQRQRQKLGWWQRQRKAGNGFESCP